MCGCEHISVHAPGSLGHLVPVTEIVKHPVCHSRLSWQSGNATERQTKHICACIRIVLIVRICREQQLCSRPYLEHVLWTWYLNTPVELLGLEKSSNCGAVAKPILTQGRDDDGLLRVRKGDFSNFRCSTVVGIEQAGLSVTQIADQLEFSRQFLGPKICSGARDERESTRLTQEERKTRLTFFF